MTVTNVNSEIEIHCIEDSISVTTKGVFLSYQVLPTIMELLAQNHQLKKLSDALSMHQRIKLISSKDENMYCEVDFGVTFRYIASLFEIRCPHLVPQAGGSMESRSHTAAEMPCFIVKFWNAHFPKDYYQVDGGWKTIGKIFFDGCFKLRPMCTITHLTGEVGKICSEQQGETSGQRTERTARKYHVLLADC
eukprot:768114-Hanusia_phi.AAC.1